MLLIGITISLLTAAYELLTQQRGIVWVPYGIINPLLLLLPRLLRRPNRKRLELFGALIILFNVPGSLLLHDMGIQYDRVLHFVMGMIVVFTAVTAFSSFYKNPEVDKKRILIWSGMTIFAGLFLFEWWQFTADRWFGSQLFFDTEQDIVTDFWEDILFGTLGLIAGLLYSSKIKYER